MYKFLIPKQLLFLIMSFVQIERASEAPPSSR